MHLVNPGERVVLIADVYGGVYRMTSQVYEPKGYVFDYVPAAEFDEPRRRTSTSDTRMVWIETPVEPAAERRRHPRRRRGRARGRRDPRRRQHVRDAVPPAARSSSAPTSSSTRRRSTSAATPTSSAASSATNDPTIAERLSFLQKSLGAVPGPFDSLARPARDQDARRADAAALRERARDRRLLERQPARRAGALPGPARRTPATRSRRGRCATSAGWSRSSPRREEDGRRARRDARSSSSSPSRSAASRA